MNSIFDVHPLLLLSLGPLLAPVLIRQLQFTAFRRTWLLLPLAGIALIPAAALSTLVPSLSPLVLLLSTLLLGLVALRLLRSLTGERDREVLELFLALPGILWLPLLFRTIEPQLQWKIFAQEWLPLLSPLYWMAVATLLVFILTGAQEKFRLNRSPASMAGLPFRLAMLALILILIECLQILMRNGGPA